MTLDERNPRWEHQDLKYPDDFDDAGSEEAMETLYRLDHLRARCPWMFGDHDDDRVIDARAFPSAGTDEVEQWREAEPNLPWDAA